VNGPDGAIYDTPSCTVTPGNTTKSITQGIENRSAKYKVNKNERHI